MGPTVCGYNPASELALGGKVGWPLASEWSVAPQPHDAFSSSAWWGKQQMKTSSYIVPVQSQQSSALLVNLHPASCFDARFPGGYSIQIWLYKIRKYIFGNSFLKFLANKLFGKMPNSSKALQEKCFLTIATKSTAALNH